nr:hypothetical protein [Tanacetum cinerariifolium]
MSTRSSARNLFPPLDNLELTIRRRSHIDPTLLNDFEMAVEGNGDPPVPDLRSGNFMKRYLEECYDLIENMTAHHNNWDTSAQRSESSSSITSSFDRKIAALKAEIAKINKNLMRVIQVNQQVKAVTLNCETCGGPHSYIDCPATVGQTQNVYAAGAYQGGNSYQPQESELSEPKQESRKHLSSGEQPRKEPFFQGASHGQNLPLAYQASAYQSPSYQALVHQPLIPQPQVVTTNEFTNFMKVNDAILKNMQTNMTSLTNSNLELKNMFGQFMKMNTASSSCLGTLPGNTITNPKEELKGITTRSGTAYQGPTIPTTSSSLPKVVERKTEVTKDTVPPTNNGSTKAVQPLVVQTESPILNSDPIFAPIIEPVVAPISALKPSPKPSIPYPSKLNDQKLCDKANDQKEKFFEIFQDLNFNISFADALILMSKFGPSIKIYQTSRYSVNYNDMTENRIDVIDMACEEYSQEVLDFFDVIASGNPTPYYDLIVSTSSPTLTPFEDSDFLLEEVDAFLALEDDPTSPEVDQSYFNLEGDILLLEAFLNDDPSLPLPTQGNYLPQVRKEFKICEAKTEKYSIDEPSEVELKD